MLYVSEVELVNVASGRSTSCRDLVRRRVYGYYEHHTDCITKQHKKIALQSFNKNMKMVIDIAMHGYITVLDDGEMRQKVPVVVIHLINKYFTQQEIFKTLDDVYY